MVERNRKCKIGLLTRDDNFDIRVTLFFTSSSLISIATQWSAVFGSGSRPPLVSQVWSLGLIKENQFNKSP